MSRLLFHITLILLLGAFGTWIAYQDYQGLTRPVLTDFAGLETAMYWFAFLVYVLISSLFYLFLLLLGRRPLWPLLCAHLFAIILGVTGAFMVVNKGKERYTLDKPVASGSELACAHGHRGGIRGIEDPGDGRAAA